MAAGERILWDEVREFDLECGRDRRSLLELQELSLDGDGGGGRSPLDIGAGIDGYRC